jgi:hypothetical protein
MVALGVFFTFAFTYRSNLHQSANEFSSLQENEIRKIDEMSLEVYWLSIIHYGINTTRSSVADQPEFKQLSL